MSTEFVCTTIRLCTKSLPAAEHRGTPISFTGRFRMTIPLRPGFRYNPPPLDMGPLAFAESSQNVEIGRNIEISDASEALLAQTLARFAMHETPFDLGEVAITAAGPIIAPAPTRQAKRVK